VLRLFTFGGLGVESLNGTPAPRLRRPHLAMLAVLAATGDRGVSRERLAALFWPDSDEEHARHSARQVLYALRHKLGRDVVQSIGSNLNLDSAAMTSDVGEFRTALAAGDRALAIARARGPFLDGFYLPGASGFERWMEEERGRLTSAVMSALHSLATDATVGSDRDAAVEWWRQLTALDPLSGRFAVGYLKALGARGDRAEALAFVRQHEMVIRRELETDLDPDVRRLEAELRAISSPEVSVPDTTPVPAVRRPDAAGTAPAVVAGPRATRHWSARRWAIAAALTLVMLSGTAAIGRQRGWFGITDASPTLAVGMIREDGVPDSQRLGRVLTDMVATNLARVEGLRVLSNSRLLELMRAGGDSAAGYSDAARRAGATELLEGQLIPADSGMTLEIRRVELRTGIVRGVYQVTASDRYAVVDSITGMVANALHLATPPGPVAEATTNSLMAYRFYEEGLRAFYSGERPSALRLFRAALDEDSMFAMAAWYEARLIGAFGEAPDGRHGTVVRRNALRLAQRAPERERLTITANLLWEDGEPAAVAVAESLAMRYPIDPRALMTLSRVQSASGHFAAAAASAERAVALDSQAMIAGRDDCVACDDFAHLYEVYSWWDSLPAAQRVGRRWLAARPGDEYAMNQLSMAAARLGDTASAQSWNRRLVAVSGMNRVFQHRLDLLAEEYDAVEQAVMPFLSSTGANDRGEGFWAYFMALRNQGRLRAAMALAREGWFPGLPPLGMKHEPSPIHQAIVAFDMSDGRAAVRLFAMAPVVDARFTSGRRQRDLAWRGARVGMSLAAAGDTAAVRVMADSVEAWGRGSLFGRDQRLHHYLRGKLHALSGRHEDAVREYEAAMFAPSVGFTRVNYEMARSLVMLNRPREAVAVLQAALRGVMDASNLYVSRTELHEFLAESFDRAGMIDSAAVHYRAVVRAWRRADPMFHPRRDQAAAWLVRHGRAPIASTARSR